MKIGILSDTHGSLYFFEKALEVLKDCDRIIHTGDVLYHGPRNDLPGGYNPKGLAEKINTMSNIYIVKGNCDSEVDQMIIKHPFHYPCLFIEFNNKRIFCTHGYLESEMAMIMRAREAGADILISGHTHIKGIVNDQSIIVMNPGSTALPKDGSRSCAIIHENKIELWDIEDKTVIETFSLS